MLIPILTLPMLLLATSCYGSGPEYLDPCECNIHHPQTLLCRGNFVAKVKLLRKKKLTKSRQLSDDYYNADQFTDQFTVKILQEYKRNSNFTAKKVYLFVSPIAALPSGCPPTVFELKSMRRRTFVIGGFESSKGVSMDGCENFHRTWEGLTDSQKRLLKSGAYWKDDNCRCHICWEGKSRDYVYQQYSYYDNECSKGTNECVYNINEEKNQKIVRTYNRFGFDFSGCFQGNAICEKTEARCVWKFARKSGGLNSTDCN